MVLVSLLNLFCPAWISPNLLPNHPSKAILVPCQIFNMKGKGFFDEESLCLPHVLKT